MWIARWLRQSVQCLSALACVLLAGTQWIPTALAQDYPVRPVRIIAPFPPGGGADIILRALGPRMAQALGQPVIIDNHAGGGGTIGTKLAAAATPDGYTLVLGLTGTLAINPGLYPDLSYDPQKDFTPIALLATGANVLVANPGLEIRSIDELIAYAKLHPGKLTYASSGIGGAPHLAGVLLGSMADVELVHIPYKGGAQATADLLGGHETFMLERKFEPAEWQKPGKKGLYFNFTKTARKPYDLLVCLVMIAMHQTVPCSLGSDGNAEDWEGALETYNKVFGTSLTFTDIVRD